MLGGSPLVGATGATYIAHSPGIYTVQVTLTGGTGCFETSVGTLVTEYPLPNPLVTYDATEQILHTQTYYTSYKWYKDLALIPGATSSAATAIGNGSYKVQVTDSNGCQSFSDAYPLTNWHAIRTGTNTVVAGTDIHIYPNPAQATVHIESPVNVRAMISSLDGKVLIDEKIAVDVDISRLADGMYMILLYDDNNQVVKTEKLIKAAN